MDASITRLLDAMRTAAGPPPADLDASLRGLPDPGSLPSPWETWTLVGLVRHRGRQAWVRDIIHTRLRGEASSLAVLGSLGHPEGTRQTGSVPGMPEWEYFFHGRGCCLTHKVEGTAIDVDFYDDSTDYFDTFFYLNFLKSLRRPEPPEERLLALHPSRRPLTLAVADLLAAGALTPLPGRDAHPYRLADGVLDRIEEVEAFCAGWADPLRRPWLAALIGDWPAAHELTAGRGVEVLTAGRAERCRTLRYDRLRRESGHRAGDALHGLADLGAAADALGDALRGPPSGTVSAALEVAGQTRDPRWCPEVYGLFRRVSPAGPIPEPHLWITALKLLLGHGYRTEEILGSLPQAGGTVIGEAVLLALEHAPLHALPLIRTALLSPIPVNRSQVAAILAVIARPWSIRELLGALAASDDQEKTADARAALLETGDPDAERAVLAWEEQNPHEDEAGSYLEIGGRRVGPFSSLGEDMLKNRGEWIRSEMDTLHDRVRKIRDIVPPEPGP